MLSPASGNSFPNTQLQRYIKTQQRQNTEKMQIHISWTDLQVLGFLLLGSVGANFTATGGSGAQLRGEEGEDTLHHPPSTHRPGATHTHTYT